jgi:hypothetical protein
LGTGPNGALYIDLNPVRAGLARLLGEEEPGRGAWAEVGAAYRRLLFRTEVVASQLAQAVLEAEAARRVVEEQQGGCRWGKGWGAGCGF